MLKVITNRFNAAVINSSETRKSNMNHFCPRGRISFYDEYGVIRDVMQNHLTEIMTLLTMRLPRNLSSSEEILRNKLQIFSSLLPLRKNQAVVGQYQAYKAEVQQELNKTKDHVTLTPTFAGTSMNMMDAASPLLSFPLPLCPLQKKEAKLFSAVILRW